MADLLDGLLGSGAESTEGPASLHAKRGASASAGPPPKRQVVAGSGSEDGSPTASVATAVYEPQLAQHPAVSLRQPQAPLPHQLLAVDGACVANEEHEPGDGEQAPAEEDAGTQQHASEQQRPLTHTVALGIDSIEQEMQGVEGRVGAFACKLPTSIRTRACML